VHLLHLELHLYLKYLMIQMNLMSLKNQLLLEHL